MLLVFISLFTNLSLLGLDYIGSQPNAILMSLIIFPFLRFTRLPKNLVNLVFVSISAVLVLTISVLDFSAFRSMVNYISISFVPIVIYKVMHYFRQDDFTNIIKFGIWVWLFVALIQFFVDPYFGHSLLPHQSGSLQDGRGVTSMATEPTYFGYALISLFTLVLVFFEGKERRNYSLLLMFQLIFLSRSTTAIATLLLALFTYFLFSSGKLRVILFILAIPFAGLIYYYFYVDTSLVEEYKSEVRILKLAYKAIENPESILIADPSGNRRFLAIFLSIRGTFDNFFVPHGYGHFNEYIYSDAVKVDFKSMISYLRDYTRIQSSLGGILYELGFMGLIALYAIIQPFWRIRGEASKFAVILFILILLNPVPFSNCLVHLIMGATSFLAFSKLSSINKLKHA